MFFLCSVTLCKKNSFYIKRKITSSTDIFSFEHSFSRRSSIYLLVPGYSCFTSFKTFRVIFILFLSIVWLYFSLVRTRPHPKYLNVFIKICKTEWFFKTSNTGIGFLKFLTLWLVFPNSSVCSRKFLALWLVFKISKHCRGALWIPTYVTEENQPDLTFWFKKCNKLCCFRLLYCILRG